MSANKTAESASATKAAVKGLNDDDVDMAPATTAQPTAAPAAAAAASASCKDAKDVKDVKDAKMTSPVGGLDDSTPSRVFKLSSKDKRVFLVEQKHAFISTLIKTSLENDDKAGELPMPAVTGSILELIVKYMQEHKGIEPPIIEKPLRSKLMSDICPHKWDAKYIDDIGENRAQLYELILAANYMDIKSLLHLGCAKVASLIKGQPLDKIKDILDPNGTHTKAGSATASAAAATSAAVGTKDAKDAKDAGDVKASK